MSHEPMNWPNSCSCSACGPAGPETCRASASPSLCPRSATRVTCISSSTVQVAPASWELSARYTNDPGVMSVKRQRSGGSSPTLSMRISSPTGRTTKRSTSPLTGSIQVERQAPMEGSKNRIHEP